MFIFNYGQESDIYILWIAKPTYCQMKCKNMLSYLRCFCNVFHTKQVWCEFGCFIWMCACVCVRATSRTFGIWCLNLCHSITFVDWSCKLHWPLKVVSRTILLCIDGKIHRANTICLSDYVEWYLPFCDTIQALISSAHMLVCSVYCDCDVTSVAQRQLKYCFRK